MNVFIEQLSLPLEEEWARFIPPLQQSCLRQMVIGDIGDAFQVGRFLIWGVRIRQDSSEEIDLKCGVLVAKLIDSLYPNGNRALLLSIASISFVAPKISLSLGPLLLQHVLDFASEHGWAGVHIGCPQNGQYGDFVRQLTASVGSWTRRPGKVVIRLSDIQRVGPLLTRLEKAVERKKGSAQWKIEPYDPKDIEQWKDRIAFSKVHQLGVPWDPDDDSYDWEPACEYSRVLKYNNTVIGWLICHFVGDDVLRYGKLWVDPGWEQSGAPLAMLCDVMRSAHFQPRSSTREGQAVGYPIPSGCLISHPSNHNLHRLVTSKFRPVCDTWTELENYYCYFS
jgi:hypothetical protein